MKIRDHEGFQIQIHIAEFGFIAEIYRREKLLKTVRDDKGIGELPFSSSILAFEAAREWIDRTYSRRIKFQGYIQASLQGPFNPA